MATNPVNIIDELNKVTVNVDDTQVHVTQPVTNVIVTTNTAPRVTIPENTGYGVADGNIAVVSKDIETRIVTVTPPEPTLLVLNVPGPQGPPGPAGSSVLPAGPYASIQFNDGVLNGSADFLFIKNTKLVLLTGSFVTTGSISVSGSLFIISNNVNQTQPAMQVNTDGIFILGEYSNPPSPIPGGFIYNNSDYYLGFNA